MDIDFVFVIDKQQNIVLFEHGFCYRVLLEMAPVSLSAKSWYFFYIYADIFSVSTAILLSLWVERDWNSDVGQPKTTEKLKTKRSVGWTFESSLRLDFPSDSLNLTSLIERVKFHNPPKSFFDLLVWRLSSQNFRLHNGLGWKAKKGRRLIDCSCKKQDTQ